MLAYDCCYRDSPVDDVTTHGRHENHLGVDHLLSNGLGANEGSSQVNVNTTPEHLNVVTFSRKVGASEEIKLDDELETL
jgi:hypothetical protein